MSKSYVILCERSGTWAAAVARQLPGDVRLRQTGGLRECALELAEHPSSLLAVELTGQNLAQVMALVTEVSRKWPHARIIVLAQRGLDACEWLLREAGAIHFTTSPRQLVGLGGLVRRHFERICVPSTASPAAHIWDALPWSGAATA
jgi:hypothetical protein